VIGPHGATGPLLSFQDHDTPSSVGEEIRRHQPVVTGADHDRIVRLPGSRTSHLGGLPVSLSSNRRRFGREVSG
jgi:hypothetical protein